MIEGEKKKGTMLPRLQQEKQIARHLKTEE
jgi:hypothetical protein